MMARNNSIILILIFCTISLAIADYTECEPKETPCNKTKVVNKVPVYTLCSWNKLSWAGNVLDTVKSGCNLHVDASYVENKNIPHTVVIKDGFAYVLVERKYGVPSTLNRIELNKIDDYKNCPALHCFPDCPSNTLADPEICTLNPFYLTNVRALYFDEDGVMYFFDVGAFYDNNDKPVVVQPPRICSFRPGITEPICFEIPFQYYSAETVLGFKTWLVNEDDGPGFLFFYLLNSKSGSIVVFSEETFTFWSIKSSLFKPEPHQSKFYYTLPNYQKYEYIVDQGVFNGALDKEGAYLSAVASNKLYYISKRVLNNASFETMDELTYNIKFLGLFNDHGQSVGLVRDKNVLYSLQVQKQTLACFNRKLHLSPEIIQLIATNNNLFAHLSSVQLYHDKSNCKKLYLLSNNYVEIELFGLDPKKKNFYISYIDRNEVDKLYPECIDYFANYHRDAPYDKTMKQEIYDPHVSENVKPEPFKYVKTIKVEDFVKKPEYYYLEHKPQYYQHSLSCDKQSIQHHHQISHSEEPYSYQNRPHPTHTPEYIFYTNNHSSVSEPLVYGQ